MERLTSLVLVLAAVMLFTGSAFCLVDLNTASQSQLESLPRIGPVKAKRIIDGRPYRSIEEITRVKGIGPKTFENLKDQITVGAPRRKKKKAVAKVKKRIEVPVYSTESFKTFKCAACGNRFKASSELKSGCCPYCRTMWCIK